jgi:predicted nucleic acid-binding Zn ribbon protein
VPVGAQTTRGFGVSDLGDDERDEGRDDSVVGTTPPRIGDLLDRVVRGLGAPGADVLDEVFGHWRDLAGPLADHARPVVVRAETLVVAVDQPAWATEMRFRQRELLDRLDHRIGAGRVTRIEVQIRPQV